MGKFGNMVIIVMASGTIMEKQGGTLKMTKELEYIQRQIDIVKQQVKGSKMKIIVTDAVTKHQYDYYENELQTIESIEKALQRLNKYEQILGNGRLTDRNYKNTTLDLDSCKPYLRLGQLEDIYEEVSGMRKISFEELNQLNKTLNQYSKEERQELLNSINVDMEKSYTELQSKNWNITTNRGNIIFNLHKDGSKNGK